MRTRAALSKARARNQNCVAKAPRNPADSDERHSRAIAASPARSAKASQHKMTSVCRVSASVSSSAAATTKDAPPSARTPARKATVDNPKAAAEASP